MAARFRATSSLRFPNAPGNVEALTRKAVSEATAPYYRVTVTVTVEPSSDSDTPISSTPRLTSGPHLTRCGVRSVLSSGCPDPCPVSLQRSGWDPWGLSDMHKKDHTPILTEKPSFTLSA